ncbi:MAG: hypothetical protein GXP55_10910 [Deltaproteobacteria bacterium]|nr:hypothetical protein [Deltaproteobacteria bacterium]
MKTLPRGAMLAVTLALFAALSPTRARADDSNGAAAWAITTSELSTAVVMSLTFTLDQDALLSLNALTPVLSFGAGILAYRHGWNPSPALAIHGAMWTAALFFITTAAIEGTVRGGSFRAGPAAYALGGVGLILGATFGALRVGPDAEPFWLGAPPLAIVGLIVGGVVAAFGSLRGWSSETVGRTIAFSTVATGMGGLTVAYVMATQSGLPSWMCRVRPSLAPVPGGAMMSLSGSF